MAEVETDKQKERDTRFSVNNFRNKSEEQLIHHRMNNQPMLRNKMSGLDERESSGYQDINSWFLAEQINISNEKPGVSKLHNEQRVAKWGSSQELCNKP